MTLWTPYCVGRAGAVQISSRPNLWRGGQTLGEVRLNAQLLHCDAKLELDVFEVTMADNADTQQAYIRQALQKNVVDLRERSKQLTRENEQLKATRDKVEKDTHEFVAYFQKEMEKKDEVIAELRDQCRKLEYNLKTEVQRLTDKYEGMIQEQSTRAQRTDTELNEKLTAAEETLFALREFREHHNEVEQQIINLKTLLETKEREHAETITSSERKFIEDKARMDRAHKDQIEEFKRLAREDAQRGLDADTRRVVIDNRRMVSNFTAEFRPLCN